MNSDLDRALFYFLWLVVIAEFRGLLSAILWFSLFWLVMLARKREVA